MLDLSHLSSANVTKPTQLINAVRGQLTEYGLVAAKGTANLPRLLALVDEPGSDLPQAARAMLDVLIGMVMMLAEQISALDREIAKRAKEEDVPSRLMTIPGVGPITATAIAALAPPVETFRKGRDFAAWLGLA
jgi:transposase